MKHRAEKWMLLVARWLIVCVQRNDHTQSFQLFADDARLEVQTLLNTYYR